MKERDERSRPSRKDGCALLDEVRAEYDLALRRDLPQVRAYKARWAAAFARDELPPERVVDRPHFLGAESYRGMVDDAARFVADLRGLFTARFGGDPAKAAAELGMPVLTHPICDRLRGSCEGCETIARPDILEAGGRGHFLEQNVSSVVADYNQKVLLEYYRDHPALRRAAAGLKLEFPSFLDEIPGFFRRNFEGKTVSLWEALKGTEERRCPTLKKTHEALARAGIETLHLDEREHPLEVTDEGVRQAGRRLDVLFRHGVAWELTAKYAAVQPLLDAAIAGKVLLYQSPWEFFESNKCLLGILSEGAPMPVPSSESALCALPWTRILGDRETSFEGRPVRLPEFSLARRRDLVIKKGFSAASCDVLLGAETEEAAWKRAVEAAVAAGGWVVQEAVRPPKETVPVVLGEVETRETVRVDSLYLLGRTGGGLWCRHCPGSLRARDALYSAGVVVAAA
ncbi:MAG: hypothetical protein WC969_06890 [Elusimicrobiota bacterium]|jgi:hypothetical protein